MKSQGGVLTGDQDGSEDSWSVRADKGNISYISYPPIAMYIDYGYTPGVILQKIPQEKLENLIYQII